MQHGGGIQERRCFNSIKVQLKVLSPLKVLIPVLGFNSIKVQLKGN